MINSTQVIVIGGGPAGISAAITIARAGKNVILIERGSFSGSKNVFGGAIYTEPTKEIFPDFENSAPLERKIVNLKYLLRTKEKEVSIAYFAGDKENNAYTVLRGKFDRWMASEAEKEGVVLVTETVVKELIVKDNKVIGIKTDLEEYFADLVILADGVNSLLAKQIGLRKRIDPKDVALGVKEVIRIGKDEIEKRFNLEENQGSVYEIIGEPMAGILGLGYLYTNKDSVSIGVGISLDELVKHKLKPYEVLEKMESHPTFSTLLKGGETVEYSAHLIPEGGYKKLPKLYDNGVMVVGDAAMLVNNIHFEGTNLAMLSGKMAGQVAICAIEKQDFSKKMLSQYQKKLEKSFIMKDLKTYKDVLDIAHSRSSSLKYYPEKILEFFEKFVAVNGYPKKMMFRDYIKSFFTDRSVVELFKDAIAFVNAMFGVLR